MEAKKRRTRKRKGRGIKPAKERFGEQEKGVKRGKNMKDSEEAEEPCEFKRC